MVLGKLDSYMKNSEIRAFPHTIQQNKQNNNFSRWFKGQNVKPETIKLLEDKMSRILFYIICNNFFLVYVS